MNWFKRVFKNKAVVVKSEQEETKPVEVSTPQEPPKKIHSNTLRAKKLTIKQRRFVKELAGGETNLTRAAITAGYSPTSAREIGCENLAKPNIKEALAKVLNDINIPAIAHKAWNDISALDAEKHSHVKIKAIDQMARLAGLEPAHINRHEVLRADISSLLPKGETTSAQPKPSSCATDPVIDAVVIEDEVAKDNSTPSN